MDIQFPATPIKKKVIYNRQKSDFSPCQSFDGSLIWDNIYWTSAWGEGSGIYPVCRFLQGVYKLPNCVKQLLCSHPLQESESELPQRQTARHCVHTQQLNVGPDPGYCGSDQKVNILLSTLGETAKEPGWGYKAVVAAAMYPILSWYYSVQWQ